MTDTSETPVPGRFTVILNTSLTQDARDDIAGKIIKLAGVRSAEFTDASPHFGRLARLQVRYGYPNNGDLEGTVARIPGVIEIRPTVLDEPSAQRAELMYPYDRGDSDKEPLAKLKQCLIVLDHNTPRDAREGYALAFSEMPGVIHTRFEDATPPFDALRKIRVTYSEPSDVVEAAQSMKGVASVHGSFMSSVSAKLDGQDGRDLVDRVRTVKGVLRLEFYPLGSPWDKERRMQVIHDSANPHVEKQVGRVEGVAGSKGLRAAS